MYKRNMMLLLGAMSLPLWAEVPPLDGYYYGDMTAPTGWEWQSPDSVAYNKQQPHAWFFSFGSVDEARKVLPENSSLWRSLDGEWNFRWCRNPEERIKDFYRTDFDDSTWDKVTVPMNWNIAGTQKDGTFKYGEPLYSNQRVIFQHKVAEGDWKGGVMRTPPQDWMTYKNRNEVGAYRRTFCVPSDWKDKSIYINFDGVDSFFYLYVNGRYVGFSKNSRNLAQFDITPYLNRKGENIVAVEVYRHSDGSFLESQDMFRLPGIFRNVSLTAKPQVQVRDVKAIPDFDASYTDASLCISADVRNLTAKVAKGYTIGYTLYANKLYSDENTLVPGVSATATVGDLNQNGEQTATVILRAGNKVKPWSAEAPYRYTLVGELKDRKGRVVETFSTAVGFRKIEIRQTAAKDDEFGLAGRYYYLNGKTVKMKGVNRHETDPATGHYISRDRMQQEIFLMKRANINHVRNCHYPDAPYWYYLCDKYGIYLEDEANIESHQYYYGQASLSHVPEFKNATVAREMEMVHATVNHPSVVIWSLGNEAGPGVNFVEAYKAIKTYDTSRPIQYERNNSIVDMGSNQYPSIGWMQGAVTGKYDIKYPFHVSEYAHSMGNAVGNLIDYWKAIESTNFFIGGAIWDWVDQAMYGYDIKTGERYWGYGGDFGIDNKPNDGMFCMNGIMRPDLSPKAQYFEVKKVYQNVGVKAVDLKKGLVEIFNKNYFEPLRYRIVWSLWKDGQCILPDRPLMGPKIVVGPRERQVYTLDYDYGKLDAASEYFVKVQFLQGKDMPWAKKGYVQMEEQLRVKGAEKTAPTLAEQTRGGVQAISHADDGNSISVTGKGFTLKFDKATGAISELTYGARHIIADGNGPKLDAYRAPTDNDAGIGYPKAWFRCGLYDLQHRTIGVPSILAGKNDGTLQVSFTVESQGREGCDLTYSNRDRTPEKAYTFGNDVKKLGENDFKFLSTLVYTIYCDGSVELQTTVSASQTDVVLPRIGYVMKLPTDLKNFEYYGRGPVNNYADRKTGQFIECHKGIVGEQDIMLPKPQAMGNREEVRWCALTDGDGYGAAFIADSVMSASALPWSQQQLTVAAHPYQLVKSDGTYLHLDAKVTGLGGASCGQGGPLEPDRTRSGSYSFGFVIRPVTAGNVRTVVRTSLSGVRPVTIVRNAQGDVSLRSADKSRTIMYSVAGKKKAQAYVQPFGFLQGGTVTAWYKDSPYFKMSMSFDKMESVPLTVAFCSSFEPKEGEASFLVDGNPSTYWHTMYSVTVANYPHWVDFDASQEKLLKGFVYQPRQDSANGRIKDYEIYVSHDGKSWGNAVSKGAFNNTSEPQRILFDKPVKARYIRLRALSEQRGQDFASGAEFSIIAE